MKFKKELWKKLSTTSLSDAMNGQNTMDHSMKPVNQSSIFIGSACTLHLFHNDYTGVFAGLQQAKPGDVLVIDTDQCRNYAFFGEIITTIAKTLGLAGIVIDGFVRDSEAIRKSGFPAFCKGAVPGISVPARGQKYCEVQKMIQCGGVTVHPGDIVFGDADGVAVIPQEQANEIFQKASAKEEADKKRIELFSNDPVEIRKFLQERVGK